MINHPFELITKCPHKTYVLKQKALIGARVKRNIKDIFDTQCDAAFFLGVTQSRVSVICSNPLSVKLEQLLELDHKLSYLISSKEEKEEEKIFFDYSNLTDK